MGLTFSCQAAAAAATSAARKAQRSTIMALFTSRHHSESTRDAVQRDDNGQDARRLAADWRARGDRGRSGGALARPAPRGLACVGLRSADLARDAALLAPTHPRG
ncbi:unnamed protein product [Parnassius apollo]|uniref:(apollo) hypothetical protein n=1 Tax=Parnassius apollo TaxID=110799 RepID=A0A8S3XL49_PARAO|nr:unnamed protein product [Parnassius apollo]